MAYTASHPPFPKLPFSLAVLVCAGKTESAAIYFIATLARAVAAVTAAAAAPLVQVDSSTANGQ